MSELEKLENELVDVQNDLVNVMAVRDEFWLYNPKNPDFMNPIKGYEQAVNLIKAIEVKISELELKINSLN